MDRPAHIAKRLLRACIPVSKQQLVPALVALCGTLIAVHFGTEKRAAYETIFFPTLVGLAIYVTVAVMREAIKIWSEAHRHPVPGLEQAQERNLLQAAPSWLRIHLSDRKLHIQRAFLFGSVVRDHYPTADVDLVVVLVPSANRRRAADRLRSELAVEFKLNFQRRLHLKFCIADDLTDFLRRAGGDHQEIYLRRAPTLFARFFPQASDTSTRLGN